MYSWGFLRVLKRVEREAGHSPLSIAKVSPSAPEFSFKF
jgi:hypothetical protein